ncbi:MAG: hypothetical protein V7641_3735 [Blastocatellia bacterium]
MLRQVPIRAVALACLFILSSTFFPASHKAAAANAAAPPQSNGNRSAWAGPYTLGAFVRRMVAGRVVCLAASTEQARRIKDRDSNLPLSDLAPNADQPSGLKIILRGTSQLQSFPLARDAFKRAAAQWESLIQTNVTVMIDVDFGPTLFDKPFDADVVGITDAQVLAGNALYPAVRAGLIAAGYTPEKSSLYNSLPAKAVPTDRGESQGLAAASATLRALGLLNQAADPDGELNSFGTPPAIGLNSKFNFDFEPGDGIEPDELDFEALALHEIGHVLGFVSSVGEQEMDASIDNQPAIWDLFRLRPEAIKSDFAAAQRVLSSGGEQRFYAGDAALNLSTGRPDGTGGDGQPPSHWKDEHLTGQYLGVMNPTIASGEHQFLTDNDLTVLDAIGYRVKSVMDTTTIIPLTSGQPQTGGMTAPPPNLGVLSHTQYAIAVPPGATQLSIDLNGDQDVDLYARFGQPVVLQGHNPTVDYKSTTDSGSETITITPSSSLPLRQGIYYMAIANYGPGDASFTVTATVAGGIASSNNNHAPAIFNLIAHLEGDALGLDYAAIDRDGDLAMAEVSILDEAGRAVRSPLSMAINSGSATQVESQLVISGLSTPPTAWRAAVTLIDRSGNRSPAATVDFSKADSGGLALTGASFTGAKLTLKARGLTDGLAVEINGRVIAPPQKIKIKGAGSKLMINGAASQLGLLFGANRIRVRNVNGWSNIFIFHL